MKLLFKGMVLFVFSICISSCNLKTTTNEVDFLYSNYSLWHSYLYKEEDMYKHSFIDYDASRSCDSFYTGTNKIEFFFNKEENMPYFNFYYQEKNKNPIKIDVIKYNLNLDNIYFGKIYPDSDYYVFDMQDITTYPNYWIRIHYQLMIEGEKKDIILEYKRDSANPV